MGWYDNYVAILRRLRSGETPGVLELFCGGGGGSEGTRRSGGRSHGVDLYDMPEYVDRFGPEAFTQGDAIDHALVGSLRRQHRALAAFASPPCKEYSTARDARTPAKQPGLIDHTRDMLRGLFKYWSIENVAGARKAMRGAIELRGSLFGLKVARPRLFESSFELVVDRAIAGPAARLAGRCCLGQRRRWRRRDSFGRPVGPCCGGNIFSPLGEHPMRCSVEQCADAMGVDVGHMSYPRLAQSIPPDYNRLRYAQCCAAIAKDQFGAPFISFDEMRRRPAWAKREIARWLRGAGDAEPATALEWQGRAAAPERAGAPRAAPAGAGCDGERVFTDEELVLRELFYSYVGGFDQQCVDDEVKAGWLDELLPNRRLDRLEAGALTGHNTYLDVPGSELEAAWPAIEAALATPATSVVVRVDRDAAERWRERGFSPPDVPASYWRGGAPSPGLALRPALVAGGRLWASRESHLDHSAAREHMDWRDQTGWKPDAQDKMAATYRPLPHAPEAWAHAARAGSGDLGAAAMARYPAMREEVRLAMTEGVSVSTETELGRYEIAQYPFSSLQAESQCGREVDRALLAGHLEPVPLSEYDQVRCVHPS